MYNDKINNHDDNDGNQGYIQIIIIVLIFVEEGRKVQCCVTLKQYGAMTLIEHTLITTVYILMTVW